MYYGPFMAVATRIELVEEDRATLENWVRSSTTEQRMVQRARIVLEAATGSTTKDVAARLGTHPPR